MNKNVRMAAAAALAVVVSYPGAAWLLGKRVESQLGAEYQKLETQGMVKVISREYQRSMYGAVETVRFETTPSLEAVIKAGLKSQDLAQGEPVRFSVRSQIKHGPLPGGTSIGAASVHSELMLEGEAAGAAERLFGKSSPLVVDTLFGFFGGGKASLSSPAVTTSFKNQAGEDIDLVWQGLQLSTDFASGLKSYSLQGSMPGLQIKSQDGFRAKLASLNISAEGKRILGDDSELYAGWTEINLADASFHSEAEPGKSLAMQKLSYRVEMPLDGDFLDLRARLGAESFKVADADYGPAHYDFSVRHLRAEAVQSMQQSIKKLYADPQSAQAAQSNPAMMLEAVRTPMFEILKQQPVFTLDRLAFRNAHGETTANGEIKLVGAEEGDFSNPFMLISKLDVKAEISTPEKNAFALAGMKMSAEGAEQIAARDAMVQQQIEAMLKQGYVERTGEMLKSKLAFSKGALTLNGKPMFPGAM